MKESGEWWKEKKRVKFKRKKERNGRKGKERGGKGREGGPGETEMKRDGKNRKGGSVSPWYWICVISTVMVNIGSKLFFGN